MKDIACHNQLFASALTTLESEHLIKEPLISPFLQLNERTSHPLAKRPGSRQVLQPFDGGNLALEEEGGTAGIA